jgi:hypothetical protein
VAVLLGALIFGEALTMVIAIGGGITIFGLYMVNHSIRKARRLALKTRLCRPFYACKKHNKKKSQANLGFFNKIFYYQILTLLWCNIHTVIYLNTERLIKVSTFCNGT